jgi:hypothetical protein
MAGLCRTDQVSWKYLRLMAFVGFGLLAGGLTFIVLSPGWWHERPLRGGALGVALAALAAGGWLAVNAAQGERPRPTQRCWPLAAAVLALAASALLNVSSSSAPGSAATGLGSPAAWLSAALGAAVLGSVTAAMLLGHSYLTHTTMPIDPLRRLSRLVSGLLIVRAAWVAGVVVARRGLLSGSGPQEVWLWLMLSVRVGVGLLAAGVMAYMIADCVRRRSTQSATGILYIAMVMTYIGELAAAELGRTFGMWV